MRFLHLPLPFSFNVSNVSVVNFLPSPKRENYLGIEKRGEKII